MKRRITTVCLVSSLLIFLQVIGIEEVLLNFVLVGELPGVGTLVPPAGMIAFWLVAALGVGVTILARKRNRHFGKFITEIKKHLPRKRYTQL